MAEPKITIIDEYIASCPQEIQETLQTLRRVILEEAPMATEKISWGMPTFAYHGNLIHFAIAKRHIGLYPAPSGVEMFRKEAPEYKTTKGGVQLPYGKPLPYDLIRRVVRMRVQENEAGV